MSNKYKQFEDNPASEGDQGMNIWDPIAEPPRKKPYSRSPPPSPPPQPPQEPYQPHVFDPEQPNIFMPKQPDKEDSKQPDEEEHGENIFMQDPNDGKDFAHAASGASLALFENTPKAADKPKKKRRGFFGGVKDFFGIGGPPKPPKITVRKPSAAPISNNRNQSNGSVVSNDDGKLPIGVDVSGEYTMHRLHPSGNPLPLLAMSPSGLQPPPQQGPQEQQDSPPRLLPPSFRNNDRTPSGSREVSLHEDSNESGDDEVPPSPNYTPVPRKRESKRLVKMEPSSVNSPGVSRQGSPVSSIFHSDPESEDDVSPEPPRYTPAPSRQPKKTSPRARPLLQRNTTPPASPQVSLPDELEPEQDEKAMYENKYQDMPPLELPPERTPERIPQRIPQKTPERTPQRIPQRIPLLQQKSKEVLDEAADAGTPRSSPPIGGIVKEELGRDLEREPERELRRELGRERKYKREQDQQEYTTPPQRDKKIKSSMKSDISSKTPGRRISFDQKYDYEDDGGDDGGGYRGDYEERDDGGSRRKKRSTRRRDIDDGGRDDGGDDGGRDDNERDGSDEDDFEASSYKYQSTPAKKTSKSRSKDTKDSKDSKEPSERQVLGGKALLKELLRHNEVSFTTNKFPKIFPNDAIRHIVLTYNTRKIEFASMSQMKVDYDPKFKTDEGSFIEMYTITLPGSFSFSHVGKREKKEDVQEKKGGFGRRGFGLGGYSDYQEADNRINDDSKEDQSNLDDYETVEVIRNNVRSMEKFNKLKLDKYGYYNLFSGVNPLYLVALPSKVFTIVSNNISHKEYKFMLEMKDNKRRTTNRINLDILAHMGQFKDMIRNSAMHYLLEDQALEGCVPNIYNCEITGTVDHPMLTMYRSEFSLNPVSSIDRSAILKLKSCLGNIHSVGIIHGNINFNSIRATSKNRYIFVDFDDSFFCPHVTKIPLVYDTDTYGETFPYFRKANRAEIPTPSIESDYRALGLTLIEITCGYRVENLYSIIIDPNQKEHALNLIEANMTSVLTNFGKKSEDTKEIAKMISGKNDLKRQVVDLETLYYPASANLKDSFNIVSRNLFDLRRYYLPYVCFDRINRYIRIKFRELKLNPNSIEPKNRVVIRGHIIEYLLLVANVLELFDNYYYNCRRKEVVGTHTPMILQNIHLFVDRALKISSSVMNIGPYRYKVFDIIDLHIMNQVDMRLLYKSYWHTIDVTRLSEKGNEGIGELLLAFAQHVFLVCNQSYKEYNPSRKAFNAQRIIDAQFLARITMNDTYFYSQSTINKALDIENPFVSLR